MDTVLILAQVLALLCLSALSIYLIVALVRLKSALIGLARDFKDFVDRAIPVLENIEVITSRFKNIAASVEQEVGALRDSMNSVKRIADNVADFERRVQERLEVPVMETVATVAAVFKGVKTFIDRLRS